MFYFNDVISLYNEIHGPRWKQVEILEEYQKKINKKMYKEIRNTCDN